MSNSIIFFLVCCVLRRRGSIIVEIELIFTKEVEDPLKPLMEIKEIGKLGKMRVKMKTMQGNIKKLINRFKYTSHLFSTVDDMDTGCLKKRNGNSTGCRAS
jgi:hypothetical protein